MMTGLTEQMMRTALGRLDELLDREIKLIVGGGAAMVLAYGVPLVTHDIDSYPKGIEVEDLGILVKRVAQELDLPGDWLNPYFSTFTHTLPSDFDTRLVLILKGKKMHVWALGKEEMLIMKCFAHRAKDIGHAKALIKLGVNIDLVEEQLEKLKSEKLPGVVEALDFLDDILEQM